MTTILVPYDGSDTSLDALGYAVESYPNAEIRVVHVIDETYLEPPYGQLLLGREELHERATTRADDIFADAETVATERGVQIDTDVVIGHPVREILDYSDQHDVEQVVLGGKGLSNVP